MKYIKRRLAEWIWDALIEFLWPEIRKAMNESYERGYLTGEGIALEAMEDRMDDFKVGDTDAEDDYREYIDDGEGGKIDVTSRTFRSNPWQIGDKVRISMPNPEGGTDTFDGEVMEIGKSEFSGKIGNIKKVGGTDD